VGVHSSLRAREPRAAAHTAVLVLGLCAAVIALFAAFGPDSVTRAAGSVPWASAAGLVVTAVVFRLTPAERLDRAGAFVGLAVVGIVVLCALIVSGTHYTATGGQAFLAFAVLYSGFHLRKGAVALVTTTAVVADAVMLAALEPLAAAVSDLVFFGAMLVIMGVLLARSGDAQERAVTALQRQASIDALTGLVTRRVFDEALATAVADPSVAGTALAVMDVDDFKAINDGHGHPVGDDALIHLARVITGQVRASDAVVCRLGGDEVAVLLAECTPEAAARRAQQLLDSVRAAPLTLPDGSLLALSISIGVAHAPGHATELRELYAAADAALYEAKRNGRGRVAIAAAPA
jgi:diguanylate cyclase (GGDEF)-like protein